MVSIFFNFYLFMIVTEREREKAETQAEGEAGSMHREPDVGFDPGSPGSRPGPKAGAKPLRHPGIPMVSIILEVFLSDFCSLLSFPAFQVEEALYVFISVFLSF